VTRGDLSRSAYSKGNDCNGSAAEFNLTDVCTARKLGLEAERG